jgi:hypothetical protein
MIDAITDTIWIIVWVGLFFGIACALGSIGAKVVNWFGRRRMATVRK